MNPVLLLFRIENLSEKWSFGVCDFLSFAFVFEVFVNYFDFRQVHGLYVIVRLELSLLRIVLAVRCHL